MRAIGESTYQKHGRGERLTPTGAISAMCYGCTGGYADGKNNCLRPDCPRSPEDFR